MLHINDNLTALISTFYIYISIVPGEPTNVGISAVNSTTIHVSWKPPAEKDRNGIIRGYHIHIHEMKEEVSYIDAKTMFYLYFVLIN